MYRPSGLEVDPVPGARLCSRSWTSPRIRPAAGARLGAPPLGGGTAARGPPACGQEGAARCVWLGRSGGCRSRSDRDRPVVNLVRLRRSVFRRRGTQQQWARPRAGRRAAVRRFARCCGLKIAGDGTQVADWFRPGDRASASGPTRSGTGSARLEPSASLTGLTATRHTFAQRRSGPVPAPSGTPVRDPIGPRFKH